VRLSAGGQLGEEFVGDRGEDALAPCQSLLAERRDGEPVTTPVLSLVSWLLDAVVPS